ncbi:hypothetical protein V3390_09245 [Luteimonas sp. FXH3W]|uniref:Uncharacterized protein n=1 Tax=Aquilutibacter rugosus TaxID=3115820 RepID=A0ABU7V129_9GAMM
MSALQIAIACSSFAVCSVVLWQLKHQCNTYTASNQALGYARLLLFVFAAWRGADALNSVGQPSATWAYALFAAVAAVVIGLQGEQE